MTRLARRRGHSTGSRRRGAALTGVYRTPPVGPVAEQPHFLNAAIACTVPATMAPTAILAALLEIEAAHGRVRTQASVQGPRTLDLDLLFLGEQTLRTAGPPPLVLPIHRRARLRARAPGRLAGPGWRMPGIDRRWAPVSPTLPWPGSAPSWHCTATLSRLRLET